MVKFFLQKIHLLLLLSLTTMVMPSKITTWSHLLQVFSKTPSASRSTLYFHSLIDILGRCPNVTVSEETKMYEDYTTTITVTTSSISHDDDDDGDDDLKPTNIIPIATRKVEKNRSLAVKKKPLKKVAKHKSHKKGGKKHSFEKKHKKNKRHKRWPTGTVVSHLSSACSNLLRLVLAF